MGVISDMSWLKSEWAKELALGTAQKQIEILAEIA